MKKIILSQYRKDQLNAGPKAKTDIEKIMSEFFNSDVMTLNMPNDIFCNKFKRYVFFLKKFYYVKRGLKNNDVAFIQYPFTKQYNLISNAKYKVCIIHDIDGLRDQDNNLFNKELVFFKKCDCIIVHNLKMKNLLMENGIDERKIFILNLFDYLIQFKDDSSRKRNKENNITLVYTGNLDKAPFLFQLNGNEMRFDINVYGTKTKEINNSKIKYRGAFSPNELHKHVEGSVGLVWDGNLDESDEMILFKNYTKYNNPHKLSFYLSINLPVIVWKKSAVADFVLKNNIGYVISNLYEINELDFSDYSEKAKNAFEIGKKVREGYYTKNTIENVLEYLSKN